MTHSWLRCSYYVVCILLTLNLILDASPIIKNGVSNKILENSGANITVHLKGSDWVLLLPCKTVHYLEDEALIQLYKGSPDTRLELIPRNDSRVIKYKQYSGYTYNASTDNIAAGTKYTCVHGNIAETDDFVVMKLTGNDNFVEVKDLSPNSAKIYYTNYTEGTFSCQASEDFFEDNFQWTLETKDGLTVPVHNPSTTTSRSDGFIITRIRMKFNRADITNVVCHAKKMGSEESISGMARVTIEDFISPQILQLERIYKGGGEYLRCSYVGNQVDVVWYRDGEKRGAGQDNHLVGTPKYSLYLVEPPTSDRSKYTCVVTNARNESDRRSFIVTSRGWPLWFVTLLVFSLSIALILLGITTCRIYKTREKYAKYMPIIKQRDTTATAKEFQVGNGQTTYKNEVDISPLDYWSCECVGKGRFGEVYRVNATFLKDKKSSKRCVAFKVFKWLPQLTEAEAKLVFLDFLNEVKIMRRLNHEHIVRYLGVDSPSLLRFKVYLIMEYCPDGSLEDFMKTHTFETGIMNMGSGQRDYKKGNPDNVSPLDYKTVRTSHLMKWAEEIASALAYLSKLKIVHRDIAARNILLKRRDNDLVDVVDNTIALLSDFGLAKDLEDKSAYVMSGGYTISANGKPRLLPTRWYAPEALKNDGYTSASDVWSFGCLLSELFTGCEKFPYEDDLPVSPDECKMGWKLGEKLLEMQEQGKTPAIPVEVPDEIGALMTKIWSKSPANRPSFTEIHKQLTQINTGYGIYESFIYDQVQQVKSNSQIKTGTPPRRDTDYCKFSQIK